MKSIRTKISILNVIAISIALTVAAVIASISFASFAHKSTEKNVELLCETGKNNLNYYIKSVEQSVKTVSTLIDNDLDETIDDTNLTTSYRSHMEFARKVFNESSDNTNGVFSYYYRVDLEVTDATGGRDTGEKGFWFIYNDITKDFEEHVVSALDESACPWFYTPKNENRAVWLLPYSTDNLEDVYVISYNVPVYRTISGTKSFVGVVGIEISYRTLGEQIKDIKALNHGYAFIVENEKGTIIYHPNIDLYGVTEEDRPQTPKEFVDGLKRGDRHIEYTYEGTPKHCYVLPLGNDNMMSIVVCAPTSDINNIWLDVVIKIIVAALVIIGSFIAVTIIFSRQITKPLHKLTDAAEEINRGNYDVNLDYKKDDEIGVLTTAFNKLVTNLGGYISDLNTLAYADALTSVGNRSAFNVCLRDIQKRIGEKEKGLQFGVVIFDCDDLKVINDDHGHDKGNVYLRNASHLIARVFEHSVVYRIGGDEFAVVLQGEDYEKRNELKRIFLEKSAEICSFAKEPWEEIRVSIGLAEYDPEVDNTAEEVAVHADHLMYENKRERKKGRKQKKVALNERLFFRKLILF